jgi:hypothetical protein
MREDGRAVARTRTASALKAECTRPQRRCCPHDPFLTEESFANLPPMRTDAVPWQPLRYPAVAGYSSGERIGVCP